MNKLKWYDYIAALLVADFMTTILVAVVFSTDLITGFISGILIALLIEIWNAYCLYRKKMEN